MTVREMMAKTNDDWYVVELRGGSFFKGAKPNRGGALAQAIRFQQARHATA